MHKSTRFSQKLSEVGGFEMITWASRLIVYLLTFLKYMYISFVCTAH